MSGRELQRLVVKEGGRTVVYTIGIDFAFIRAFFEPFEVSTFH